MSRPTDKPMARAQAHLAANRYSEAIGAFRAALGIDPSCVPARLGLADALMARGQRSVAVAGLVEAAERCAEHEQHEPARVLYGKALAIDPGRTDLHLDLAVVEQAMGRTDAAIARVEELAERYMLTGRTDEAAELLRFASSWDASEPLDDDAIEADAIEAIVEEPELEEATVVARNPLAPERPRQPAPVQPAPIRPAPIQTETVVCATVLIRPDGSLWLGDAATAGASKPEDDADMVTRVASATIPTASTRSVPVQARPIVSPAKPVVTRARPPAPPSRPAAPPSRPPAPPARPLVARAKPPAPPARPAAPSSAARSTDASHGPRITPAPRPAPADLAPARAGTGAASAAVVDRLRRRAGLGPELAEIQPGASGRGTEPIVIRRPSLGRPVVREDEVTHRVRHPRAPQPVAAH